MGLLEEEIKEIRQMIRQYDAGVIEDEKFKNKLNAYSQTEKRAKLMLMSFALAAKFKNAPLNRAFKANLLGDGTAIEVDTQSVEDEKVKCPGTDFELIARHQCLDWSGKNKFEDCEGCETGLTTKKVLLSRNLTAKLPPIQN